MHPSNTSAKGNRKIFRHLKRGGKPASTSKWTLYFIFLLLYLPGAMASLPAVRVNDAIVDLRTGPGESFPVLNSVARGALLRIQSSRAGWYKVRTSRGREGWLPRQTMERMTYSDGRPFVVVEPDMTGFTRRHWEGGVLGGDFSGDDILGVYGGYAIDRGMSIELSLTQVLGRFSDGMLYDLNLLIQPYPDSRFSPFVTLGTGIIDSQGRKTAVTVQDSSDPLTHAGVGLRIYLQQRFFFRVDYRHYVIFTSLDNNKEIDAWRGGFAFFF